MTKMGNTAFSLSSITFWTIIVLTSAQEYQYKCVVENNHTLCDANHQDFDITAEFQRLSETLGDNEKVMDLLEIYNSSIDEIPENAFLDIGFKNFKIFEGQDLTRIASNAFGDVFIAHMNNELLIDNPSNLSSFPPNYDLYSALNSLTNIAYIQIALKETVFHEIPDNAFSKPQTNVQYLVFDARVRTFYTGFGISIIGNYSFVGLSNLIAISFHRAYVQNITQNAFSLNTESNVRLTINLEDCLINDNTFENDVFTGAQRPVTVNLGTNLLSHIREETFAKFLNENNQNSLHIYGNTLNCDDLAPILWLLTNKAQYQSQILGANCANQTSIWDLVIDEDIETSSGATGSTGATSSSGATASIPNQNPSTGPTPQGSSALKSYEFNFISLSLILLNTILICFNYS